MLEGYFRQPKTLPRPTGKPPNRLSTQLRNLAWMRFLLDQLPTVRRCAIGKEKKPIAWRQHRWEDAMRLRYFFEEGRAPVIPRLRKERAPSLLDAVFDVVLHDRSSHSSLWFGDKILRGSSRPDEQRLRWLDDLVPRSADAYHFEPSGLDPWFYGAVDFSSVWYGRLYLWRAIDPLFEDPAWADVLQPDDKRGDLPNRVVRRMQRQTTLDDRERREFRSDLLLALGHVVFPEQIDDPNGFDELDQQLAAARAAASHKHGDEHPVARHVRAMPEAMQWRALSEAIAAFRLEQLLPSDGTAPVGRWWFRGAIDGAAVSIERRQDEWFCRMTNQAPALKTFLERLIQAD